MLRRIIFYFFIATTLAFATPVFADDASERITHFNSIIVVNKNAYIDVTEEINVYANDQEIKHGLVRWLPTRYVDSYGVARRVKYYITQVEMNNVIAPYHIQYEDGQLAIYIGDKNTILQPGLYAYTISYHINNAVNFFKDGDELYWNITGNKWILPIEHASVKIQLPIEATISNYFGYSGFPGERGTDFIARKKTDSQVAFAITKPLQPGQGLTVALSWQKGLITPPSWKTQLRDELNPGSYILLGLNALVFCYLFTMWIKHGKDPRKGAIIPLFEPPQNLSPEAMRFIYRMGFDMKGFSAAVVNLASKGNATMQNSGSVFTLTKIKDDTNNLPLEEKKLMANLFAKGNTVDLKNYNYKTLIKSKVNLRSDLKANYQGKNFKINTQYLWISIMLTLVGFATAIIFSSDKVSTFFMLLWSSIWIFLTCFLFYQALKMIRDVIIFKTFRKMFSALLSIIFSFLFGYGVIISLLVTAMIVPIFTFPLLFMLVVMNIVFYFLLRQPTIEGRKLMDQIEGFKMFLATTEQDRLQQLNAPSITPEKFETYLPYAIALDVENAWGERFSNMLKNAGRTQSTYHPVWYTGTSPWSGATTAAIPLLIGTALASSLTSASVSSSASGGGGFSGGGGGGGGGGGW